MQCMAGHTSVTPPRTLLERWEEGRRIFSASTYLVKHTFSQRPPFLLVSVCDLTQIMRWRVLSTPSQASLASPAGSSSAQCCLLFSVKWNPSVPWENSKSALKAAQQQKVQANFLGKGVKVEKESARDIKALFFFTWRVCFFHRQIKDSGTYGDPLSPCA